MPFVIGSRDGAPLRAYLPPHEVMVAENPDLEPYVMKNKEKVVEALLVVESKKSMMKIAQTLKLNLPPKANRPQMANMIAEKLCDFSNSEPEPENESFSLEQFLNPIYDDIDDLDGKDCQMLQKWCLEVLTGNEDNVKGIEDQIEEDGSGALRHIHNMLNTPSKGIFASKVLEKLTGCLYGITQVIKMPKEIHLHKPDEDNIFSFQISGSGIEHPIKVFASRRTMGSELIDYFENFIGISRNVFRFTWGSSEGSSTLEPFATLGAYLEQDKVIYIQLGLKGGGFVRKTILKMKSDGTNLVSSADRALFEKAYNTALTISSTSSFNLSEGLKAVPLSDLQGIKSLLAKGNTTTPNSSKLAKLHEHLPFYKDCKDVSEKLFSASEKFRQMVSESMDGIGIDEVREMVAVAIALQEQRASADVQMERRE
eukprot:s207_g44.t1